MVTVISLLLNNTRVLLLIYRGKNCIGRNIMLRLTLRQELRFIYDKQFFKTQNESNLF